MTASMGRCPRLATMPAVISAVSPGTGMPIVSMATSRKTTGRPMFCATSRKVAKGTITTPASSMLAVPALTITARDPGSRARAGVLRTAHGEVRTPAFVPLATKATVKGMLPAEVAALGYDIVLGNTFHLFLDPGHELIARLGGLHAFMGWDRPIVTDSGGFQVFSMGHGTVADEIKKTHPTRAPMGRERQGGVLAIEEDGVRFRSYLDGSERFLAPETSMAIQAAL